eukprot:266216_1
MKTIHKLGNNDVRRMVTGQVIPDASSAVREIIENSLDAGATMINVQIEKNFKKIMVKDDGSGISAENRDVVGDENCTSKITSFEEIFASSISEQNFGFRGQALHSIIVASKQVEVITKTESESVGTCIRFIRGKRTETVPAPATTGTCVIIYDMFYNTPVRARNQTTRFKEEQFKVLRVLQSYALLRPNVHFRSTLPLLHKVRLSSLGDAIQSLFSRKLFDQLVCVSWKSDDALWNVEGFVSKSSCHLDHLRSSPDQIFLFVNGRCANIPKLRKRISSFVRSNHNNSDSIKRKYPFAALNISIPVQTYDVNLTPDKQEFMFHNFDILRDCVTKSLENAYGLSKSGESIEKDSQNRPSTDVGESLQPEMKENGISSNGIKKENSDGLELNAFVNPWTRMIDSGLSSPPSSNPSQMSQKSINVPKRSPSGQSNTIFSFMESPASSKQKESANLHHGDNSQASSEIGHNSVSVKRKHLVDTPLPLNSSPKRRRPNQSSPSPSELSEEEKEEEMPNVSQIDERTTYSTDGMADVFRNNLGKASKPVQCFADLAVIGKTSNPDACVVGRGTELFLFDYRKASETTKVDDYERAQIPTIELEHPISLSDESLNISKVNQNRLIECFDRCEHMFSACGFKLKSKFISHCKQQTLELIEVPEDSSVTVWSDFTELVSNISEVIDELVENQKLSFEQISAVMPANVRRIFEQSLRPNGSKPIDLAGLISDMDIEALFSVSDTSPLIHKLCSLQS